MNYVHSLRVVLQNAEDHNHNKVHPSDEVSGCIFTNHSPIQEVAKIDLPAGESSFEKLMIGINMIIQKIDFVDGLFDTETGNLVCVKNKKYGDVLLCWEESMNIPVAKIKLHSLDLMSDANAVFEDAAAFGDEMARRWNMAANTGTGIP